MRKVGFVALAIMAFAVLTVLSSHAPTVQAQTPPTPPGVEEGITPPPDLDSAQPGDPVEEEEGAEGQGDDRPEGLPDNVDTAQPGDPVEEEEGAEGQGDDRPEGLPDNVDTGQQGDPVDEGGASGVSGTAPAPTGLSVTTSDDDSVSLSWNAVTDATAYRVEFRKSSSPTWFLYGFVYTGTSRRATGLDCNTSYSFRVKARGNGNPYSLTYGSPSNTVSRTTSLCIVSSPTGLSVTTSDDYSVSLSWNAVTNANAYKVEFRKSSSPSWSHHGYVYSGTSLRATGLDCNTSYWFRVKARANGTSYSLTYSSPSTSVSRSTSRCNAPAPTVLTVTTSDDDSVSLSWNAVTDAGVYKVEYRKRSSSTWLHHGYVYSGTSRTVTGLDCNTSYTFLVKARGDGDPYSLTYGSPSNVVSRTTSVCPSTPTTPTPTTPTPPTNLSLSVESGDDNDLDLAYTRSESPHYYQFELHRSTTQNGTYVLAATVNASASPADFDDQTKGNWYKARGKNCATSSRTECGDWSAFSTAILLPDSPAPPDPANTWTATLTSEYDSIYSEYGYWGGANGIGTLSPETFDYDGSTHTVLYLIWDQIGQRIQFRVDRCLKSTDFVSLSIGSSTYNISDAAMRYSDIQCQANGALRQKFDFNNVTTNPLPSGSTYQVTVGLSGPVTNTPAVKVETDTSEPFIGQSASLTAQTSIAFGTASSHQWQEWSGSAWTNLASATSSSHAVTSSSGGVRTFRVSATNASSVTETSSPVSIRWKPMTVAVTSSPEYPESGDATKRTVTLTASADAPSGVIYQWQQGSGDTWTNLGVSSTLETRRVTYTTRGTEKFRVQLNHTVVPTIESEAVYVTWDELAVVRDLLNTLHASTTSDTNYITDQTALVSCMNNNRASTSTPTYTSFSDILSRYGGDTKTTMEDHCSAKATRMFNTNKTVSRSELASLKTGSTLYSTLLETPQGQEFEANLADPDFLKQVSYMGAHVADPGSLQRPVYNPSSGASGQSDNPPPSVTLDQGPGLACLPAGVDKDRLTLDNKLRVINCLVFATPHSFWVKGDGTRVADLLKSMIDRSNGRYNWLDRGDWECTYSPDAALPSCLKHDVAYGGLQKVAGADTTVANGTELDEAWNPRNKALADYKFRADITKWGCQDSTDAGYILCGISTNAWMAEHIYFEAVARTNDKGWPVTERDVVDFTTTRGGFINCAEPVVPEVRNANFTRNGSRFTVTGEFVSGCVPVDLSDVDIVLEWNFVWYGSAKYPGTTCTKSGDNFSCYDDLSFMPPGTVVTGVSVYVAPKDKIYGGDDYGGEGDTGRRSTLILSELIN